MHRGDDGAAVRGLYRLTALLRYAKGLPHDRLRGRRPEADDDLRLEEPDLLLEPGMTCPDLRVVRLLVDAARAFLAALPLEVLHGVGHVHVATVDTRFLERAIEEFS